MTDEVGSRLLTVSVSLGTKGDIPYTDTLVPPQVRYDWTLLAPGPPVVPPKRNDPVRLEAYNIGIKREFHLLDSSGKPIPPQNVLQDDPTN